MKERMLYVHQHDRRKGRNNKMFVVFLLVLVFCCSWTTVTSTKATSQKKVEIEDIDVRIRFQGKDLVLTFPATINDAMLMARKFCAERLPPNSAGEDDSKAKECIRGIGKYLIDEVETHTSKKLHPNLQDGYEDTKRRKDLHYEVDHKGLLTLTLRIQDEDYLIRYDLKKDRPIEVARKFCINHMKEFGLTKETIDSCVLPIEKSLREAELENKTRPTSSVQVGVDSDEEGDLLHKTVKKPSNVVGILKVTLNIGGYNYEVHYDPQKESAKTAAIVFCRQNAHVFGITSATMSSCVDPIVARLKEVERDEASKLQENNRSKQKKKSEL